MGKTKILTIFLLLPLVMLVALNFISVFTPEIGFDALWYHLTLPKLWLLKKQYYFPGGLLYYSTMPRLTELLFIPLIRYTGEIGPKMLQYLSGLGASYYLWQIGKHFKFSRTFRIVALSLFYCTWLISWQSSSAYIDLFRTFLEIIALFLILKKKIFLGGMFLGLALGTKWLVLFSCLIYVLVFGWRLIVPIALTSFPWFLISFYYTKNPIYPLFSPILQNGFQGFLGALKNLSLAPFLFTFPFDDFISPLAGLIFSFAFLGLFALKDDQKKVALVGVLGALTTLILNPPSARFLLPFFPALIISSLLIIDKIPTTVKEIFITLTIFSSVFILLTRVYAFQKHLPYLTGQQSKNDFLYKQAKRLPDTFIDSDNYVKNNLPASANYLIDKLHNLYYFPYAFDHTSWSKEGLKYDYLVTTGEDPDSVSGDLINTNQVGIQIFKLK